MTILERDFIQLEPSENPESGSGQSNQGTPPLNFQVQLENDPAIVSNLIRNSQASIEELKQTIKMKLGSDLFDFILQDQQKRRQGLSDPQSFGAIVTGMNAASWINEKIMEWFGEKNVADTLAQSVPNNITSEMGLELLDVTDMIRPYPEVIDYLQDAEGDRFLDGLVKLNGGREARNAIDAYLSKYGMRCIGEIGITRTRWSEQPTALVPLILLNIKNFEPGAAKRRFEQGR